MIFPRREEATNQELILTIIQIQGFLERYGPSHNNWHETLNEVQARLEQKEQERLIDPAYEKTLNKWIGKAMDKLKKLLNRETILYIIFGVATTAVNYIVFHLLYNVLWDQSRSLIANAVAFVAAVIFAFVVNKLFVFESKSWSAATLKREIPSFLAARIGSFGIEEAGLFLAEKVLKLGGIVAITVAGVALDWITVIKVLLAFVVVALNYVFCKLFIFKK